MSETNTIALPISGIDGKTSANVTITGELMKNMHQASPISPTDNVLVAVDSDGNPMIFSIDESKTKLNLLKFAQGQQSGYEVIELTKGFDGHAGVKTFDIHQNKKGEIAILVALTKDHGPATDMYVAAKLSNDYTQTDWSKFSTMVKQVSGVDAKFVAEKTRIGATEHDKGPLIVVSGAIDTEEYYYDIQDGKAKKFEFPENVKPDTLMQLTIGYAFGQRAYFFLYAQGEGQTLEATTLADELEGSETYSYSPGHSSIPAELRYNCIATPVGSEDSSLSISSDIFCGTDDKIVLFHNGQVGQMSTVTDQVKDVHEIIVKEDADSIVLWAMASPSSVYYIYGNKDGGQYRWNSPILFAREAIHIAPIRNDKRKSNELFLVNNQGSVTHYWQDPDSTLWNSRRIKIKSEDYVLNFDSFTTHINITDQNNQPLVGQSIQLTSSEWAYAMVNGLIYSLDKDTPATVPLDVLGNVTIVNMTTNISSPVFHVQADFLESTLNIFPNEKVKNGMQAVKKGADLQQAKTQDGKPLLDKTYPTKTLDGIVTNMSTLTGSASKLGGDATATDNSFVTLSPNGQTHAGQLNTDHLPKGVIAGMKLENGNWVPHDAKDGFVPTGGVGDELASLAGDALHWLDEAFDDGLKYFEQGITYLEDGVSFVIHKVEDGVLNFVVTIGDKVLNIALDTLSAVFQALSWVLKLVEIVLEKVLAWLGYLLGWTQIWETHKVISKMMTNALKYGQKKADQELDKIKAFVDAGFKEAREKVKNTLLPSEYADKPLTGSVPVNNPLNSSAGNWIMSHIFHGGLFKDGSNGSSRSDSPVQQLLTDIVEPTILTVVKDTIKDVKDIEKIVQGNTGAVYQFAVDSFDTMIDPLQTVVDGTFKFIKDLIQDFVDMISGDMDIPFLSSFYKFVTGLLGDSEDLTVANGVSLALAIPVTLVYRLDHGGTAPFDHGTYGFEAPDFLGQLATSGGKGDFVPTGASSAVEYSKIGGMIASIAGMGFGIGLLWRSASAIQSTGGFSGEDQPLTGGGGNKRVFTAENFGIASLFALALAKDVCSFPVPLGKRTPDALAITSWVVTVIKDAIALSASAIEPAREAGVDNATVVVGDIIIVSLSVAGEATGDPNVWSILAMSLSNGGAIVSNAGAAWRKYDEEPIGQIIGAAAMLLGGFTQAFGGGITGLIGALERDEVNHIQNVGG